MRVKLSEEQLQVIVHALREEKERIVAKGGNQYSHLSLDELGGLISRLESNDLDPIKAYMENRCPECYVKIIDGFCQECKKRWRGDEVLKQFY